MTGNSFGYGQLQPNDGAHDLNAIAFVVRQMVARLDTMKLVQVKAVHAGTGTPPATGTVDVLPLVNQIDANGFPVPHGTVYGIPFFRLQGGKWAVILDPAVNDVGYVLCADRDSSNVAKNPGQQVNPGSRRRLNIADGIYVGGLLNAVPAATLWLKPDGTLKVSDSGGNVIDTSSGSWVFTGNVEFKNNVMVDGSLNVSGDTVSDGVDLKTHIHSGVTTGGGDTGPPV
jgi:hypothetical protein